MAVVKDFPLNFTSSFMGSVLVSGFLLISFGKYGCTLTVLLMGKKKTNTKKPTQPTNQEIASNFGPSAEGRGSERAG